MEQFDTIILGAGAAGLFCAKFATLSGGRVLVVDHAKRPAEKVRISGGGRCNFTNLYATANNYISQNKHFAKSALARYTQWDFIDLLASHSITWHEKTLGQLFCDGKSSAIIDMLLAEASKAELRLSTEVGLIERDGAGFQVTLSGKTVQTRNLVVATGGKSIPKMGATSIGYRIAEQFGLPVLETRPGLVPLTFAPHELDWIAPLAGTALDARVSANGTSFDEALLFTHRGLSGPSILQISNYWREGDDINVNMLPTTDVFEALKEARSTQGRKQMQTVLATLMPAKLATALADKWNLKGNLADQSDKALTDLADRLHAMPLKPTGSEGYRTAEVTLGGVDTDALSSKTMESKTVPGLYFIGEVVDVTGWLGGYNFQWAWASAAACGRAIAEAG
ncbi:BaiN/RdsA family NAD(P)/FAD-dependent oxidoreductase [Celeribacter litoreus]|uniref:NAD(P)/FAD-dependent oxidoreductase n=1 Tax=Celeribacter litoreus TaxID=2876714 RepID=UPI001CCD93B1|nr:NAD(P)/FAD-dependent oxidoreductase [Celeribacter litoreus]MCA0043670.1 NAD(P)/FAD-dependent oxidoreductase [Celeribacter litoreus]